jgi:hypothetical protein
MDQLLYWLDRSGWIVVLQHAWIWASLTLVLAMATIVGMVALVRHYDGDGQPRDQPQAQV